MRSSNIIVFCLLATSFYFLSQTITSSSSPPTFLPGRRSLRILTMSSSNHQDQFQQIKVGVEIKRSINLEGSMTMENGIKEDAEELLYHIDYHGVTTHPTPISKHP